jgi:opacity protein-like surface antigen
MRINKLGSLIGMSAVLLLSPLTAAAQRQGPGIYVGASWGAYAVKNDSLNKHEQVFKGVVGGMFNNWLGIEGSWIDFNKANNGGDHFQADGTGLAAVLAAPIGTMSSAFIKGGGFWWNSDSQIQGVGSPIDNQKRKGSDPFWGGGVKLGFNNYLALRLEYERYEVKDTHLNNTHLNTVTGGLEFKF